MDRIERVERIVREIQRLEKSIGELRGELGRLVAGVDAVVSAPTKKPRFRFSAKKGLRTGSARSRVLAHLRENDSVDWEQCCKALGLSRSNVSCCLSVLYAKGYATRKKVENAPSGHRMAYSISPRGMAFLERVTRPSNGAAS